MTPSKKPERDCDSVEVTLFNRGWNAAMDATPPAAPVQEPVGYEYHEYRPYGAPGEIRINAILKSRYTMPDGSTAGDYQWLIDEHRANQNTIKLIPLYTTPPKQPAPTVQETFGYLSQHTTPGQFEWQFSKTLAGVYRDTAKSITAVYTTPPAAQRQWVGLTQEEFRDFATTFEYGTGGLIRAIEAKLKEKNNG